MNLYPPWRKPNSDEAAGRWVKVLGLNWGLFPGWHYAHWNSKKKGWYHHSYSRVSCVICWKYVPNPNEE